MITLSALMSVGNTPLNVMSQYPKPGQEAVALTVPLPPKVSTVEVSMSTFAYATGVARLEAPSELRAAAGPARPAMRPAVINPTRIRMVVSSAARVPRFRPHDLELTRRAARVTTHGRRSPADA